MYLFCISCKSIVATIKVPTLVERCDYVTLELDVSQGPKLYFLVDSGADISLVKSKIY